MEYSDFVYRIKSDNFLELSASAYECANRKHSLREKISDLGKKLQQQIDFESKFRNKIKESK